MNSYLKLPILFSIWVFDFASFLGSEKMQRENQYNGPMDNYPSSDVLYQALELNRQGEDMFGKGKIEKAAQKFQEAVHMSPGFSRAYNNLGVVQWEKQDFSKAQTFFLKALEIDPAYKTALLNLETINLFGFSPSFFTYFKKW